MSGFHFLSDATLESLGISPAEIADRIEQAVADKARDTIWTAPKASVMPGDGRYMMATLSTGNAPALTAVKTVTVSPENPKQGLPAINGAIMLTDAHTGLLKAVMDAGWVTAVRTAGLSAVAARRLANPQSQSIAFIGCGVQAHSHLETFCQMFPLKRMRAFGRGKANVEKLCASARERGLDAGAAATPREAIEDADIVVSSITLDYTIEPFLDAHWLKGGAFAAVTDLNIPWRDETMDAYSSIFIDDREQERASAKPMIDESVVTGDLTELVSGSVAAKLDPQKPVAFVFRGLAIGDYAIAALGYERALEKGLGTLVEG